MTSILLALVMLTGNPGFSRCPDIWRPLVEADNKTVKIGFLTENSFSVSALRGAEMAVFDANQRFKALNLNFELISRSMEGPWGSGSKETVNLIFDYDVSAIAGSFEGRNAHLAEQVCAKSGVVLISSKATDPTLTQAYVPWYLCIVPGDILQAEIISEEIYLSKKQKPLIIRDNLYDSKQAAQCFINYSKSKSASIIEELIIDDKDSLFMKAAARIKSSKAGCVIIYSHPGKAVGLIKTIRKTAPGIGIYLHQSVIDEDKPGAASLGNLEGAILVSPGYPHVQSGERFVTRFHSLYGKDAGPSACYAYDAVSLLCEAIAKTGTERSSIQSYLANGRFSGVTGDISFDSHGNRKGINSLVKVLNGQLSLYR